MASKKKKKFYQQPKGTPSSPAAPSPSKGIKLTPTPLRFALIVTLAYFVVVMIGMLTHEMWRDEHQAWLVARDANSLPQLLDNMRYEGNPALWHFFLFIITRITHDPIAMQIFHVLVAASFIFIFNRYSPFSNLHKILFTFGYFIAYEYAVISRSYALGILLVFAVCALYKNRTTRYILIGGLLALLSNVTPYAIVLAGGIAGILVLDYFLFQKRSSKTFLQLAIGLTVFILGLAFSFYQIWPEKDNSFPAPYATSLFDFIRWWEVSSKLFTTYMYVPEINEHFWNTNIYFKNPGAISSAGGFSGWLSQNPSYLLSWVVMPVILFFSGVIIFLRKKLVLLLYVLSILGLFTLYYYTALMYSRYCGYLLIALIMCYWLAEYYPEKKSSGFLATLGKKISKGFLTTILALNVIGTLIAYSMEIQYKFSPSKDVATFIKENKLDSLPIVGITDFTISPLATYLDTKIFYTQMNDFGSFTVWSKKRKDQITFGEAIASLGTFVDKGNQKVLWIKDSAPQVSIDGTNQQDMEKAILRNDLQVDLLKKFSPGIVADERYFIYLVQKIDPAKADFSKYMKIE